MGNTVAKIRKTQKGELLIQVKNGEKPTSEFKEDLGASLDDNAEVKSVTSLSTIECKDIDQVTTAEDVVSAIRVQHEIDISVGDVTLRKAFGGTQIASIKTAGVTAKKLLEKRKLRLVWSFCHFREKATMTKLCSNTPRCIF